MGFFSITIFIIVWIAILFYGERPFSKILCLIIHNNNSLFHKSLYISICDSLLVILSTASLFIIGRSTGPIYDLSETSISYLKTICWMHIILLIYMYLFYTNTANESSKESSLETAKIAFEIFLCVISVLSQRFFFTIYYISSFHFVDIFLQISQLFLFNENEIFKEADKKDQNQTLDNGNEVDQPYMREKPKKKISNITTFFIAYTGVQFVVYFIMCPLVIYKTLFDNIMHLS